MAPADGDAPGYRRTGGVPSLPVLFLDTRSAREEAHSYKTDFDAENRSEEAQSGTSAVSLRPHGFASSI